MTETANNTQKTVRVFIGKELPGGKVVVVIIAAECRDGFRFSEAFVLIDWILNSQFQKPL